MVQGGVATVLVVDDDEAVADVYASQLSESYDVSTAYDGESALEQVTADVDVVLLDRRMHGLSGREVLERIRGRDIDCGVVMVTAVDPGFDIVDMGFDDYLLKPVEGAQLQSVVAEAVNRLDKRAVVREYHALSAKVATLRVEKNPAELESSEEYQRLRARLEDLEARIEDGADAESDG
ncbi:response regulator transcription factor [Halosimplex carlsbadense]|uniref:response regulator transcription factor n=1 Tax=Halosimplex carlsbadense TaxID=171164 RepID=UPI00067825E9|nr:response regulator [Halosimplex carlsbadense]